LNVSGRCKEWKFTGAEKTRQDRLTILSNACKKTKLLLIIMYILKNRTYLFRLGFNFTFLDVVTARNPFRIDQAKVRQLPK
jgi:hypothetical protein